MLNRNNFDIAELAPNDEDSPPILCGIQVSPGATAVTNGHMAVMVKVKGILGQVLPKPDHHFEE